MVIRLFAVCVLNFVLALSFLNPSAQAALPPLGAGSTWYAASGLFIPGSSSGTWPCLSTSAELSAACYTKYAFPLAGQAFTCFDHLCGPGPIDPPSCHTELWEQYAGQCLNIVQRTDNLGFTCSTGYIDPVTGNCSSPPSPAQDGTTKPDDVALRPDQCTSGMCVANAHLMLVSLNLNDTPVGYQPQVGPSALIRLSYNHKETGQPATFNYSNVGQKWTHNFLSFIQDDPVAGNEGLAVMRAVGGGGFVTYAGYNSGSFAQEAQSSAVLTRIPATGAVTSYQLAFPDGSKHVFAKLDSASTYPRRVFLTQIIDPAGNTLTMNYDASLRLTSLTDAAARTTTFAYANANPLLITKITDPFGRFATLAYDGTGRLTSITDVLGIVSSFVYSTVDPTFITTLVTPYGNSSFSYGEDTGWHVNKWLELTDPLGFTT